MFFLVVASAAAFVWAALCVAARARPQRGARARCERV